MNYEEFSPDVQKVIDQFRNLIENIKSGKDESTIKYYWSFVFDSETVYFKDKDDGLTPAVSAIYSYCFIARLPALISQNIVSFLKEKNYFLPKFSSFEDFQQNKHKYPFIEE